MTRRKLMSDQGFEAVAQRFRVLSEPMRLKILYHLGEEELTVSDLVERTGASQSNVSKHLGTLLAHGLVKRRREGTLAYYSVTDPSVFDLCNQVCVGIERDLENRRRALK